MKMNQKLKKRDAGLKQKEESLKKVMTREGNELKKNVNRIGKIALGAGILSLFLYWIFNLFRDDEDVEEIKSVKSTNPQGNSLTVRAGKLIAPYAMKLFSSFIEDKLSSKK